MTRQLFLSTAITLKLFPANFFYWFYDKYNYFPAPHQHYNQLKQFVRFTDSGHIISLLYCMCPTLLPIAFNVHFVITFGYWYGKLSLGMKDADEIENDELIPWMTNLWSYANHGLPLLLLAREIILTQSSSESCNIYFTNVNLYWTYTWSYIWFVWVYLPWRIITNDPVYGIFNQTAPIIQQIKYVLFIHLLVYLGNNTGYFLQRITRCVV